MVKLDMMSMLKDGYTRKMAISFLNSIERENNNDIYDKEYREWAHEHGFLAESACLYGLNEQNIGQYMSDYDYWKVWPLNNWSRIWINDKLTLKYILSNSDLKMVMPDYYYYSTPNGLRYLPDNEFKDNSVENFLKLLMKIGVFACKPCNGECSTGFVKLSYENESFKINDNEANETEIVRFINEHPNYIFTEYMYPTKEFLCYGNQIHTLRVVVMNPNGDNPEILSGYLRLPSGEGNAANYILHDGTNNEEFNIFVGVDFETGKLGRALKTFPDRGEDIVFHPSTGAEIKGILPNYVDVKEKILKVAEYINNVEYLGFDIGITDKGFKIMEINSHPGPTYMQVYRPMYTIPSAIEYFQDKLSKISALDEEQMKIRNEIPR